MRKLSIAALALAFLASFAVAEETIKSGPQVGEDLEGPFHPLNINGPQAGKKFCLYCANGAKPVVMVFAREPHEQLSRLVKKVDEACSRHKDAKLNSFVVFCSNDEGLEDRLKKLANDANLKHVVLSIENPAGPEGYKVAREADVTVVLYVNRNVKANFSFKKGQMKDKDIENILAALPKILAAK